MTAVSQILKISALVIIFAIGSFAKADDGCFQSLSELRAHLKENNLLTKSRDIANWSGEDNENLSLTLEDSNNSLQLSLAEGRHPWADGQIEICPTGKPNEFRIHPLHPLRADSKLDPEKRSVLQDPKTSISIKVKDSDSIDIRISRNILEKAHYGFKAD